MEQKMKFDIRILESNSQIASAIIHSIKDVISGAIKKSMNKIIDGTKEIVSESLRQEPEYGSLMSGKLKADFGIPNSSVVQRVVDALADTITVSDIPITANKNGLRGGFVLTMMKSDDLNGVIYQDIANVSDIKGYTLPWLEWLLLQNNSPIIKNYEVKYGPSPYSRSGLGIMVPSDDDWRVPPEFAGSQENNWTTRAVDRSEAQIYKLIQQSIEKNI
jgi:hypothetical protein